MKRAIGWLVLIGCAGCGRPPAPPATWIDTTPTARDVAETIRERSGSLTTIRADMELVFTSPGEDRKESCRASLSYVRPSRLRLRGTSASFFTLFELVADERQILLDVPREKLLIRGGRDDPAWGDLPLSAPRLLVALLADPCPGGECLENAVLEVGTDRHTLRGAGWTMTLDAETGLPEGFRDSSERPFEIVWDDWALRRGVAWPHEIEIRPGGEAPALRVRMGRLTIGKDVPEKIFVLEPNEDREILSPEAASERWAGVFE